MFKSPVCHIELGTVEGTRRMRVGEGEGVGAEKMP